MNFSFGITTDASPQAIERTRKVIDSIVLQRIPQYQIILVGNIDNDLNHHSLIKVLRFDETQKSAWITKKKNLITAAAEYDNVVYMHDYIALEDGWYQGWLKFGEDYQVCMNRISNLDGKRFRDWVLWPDDTVTNALTSIRVGDHDCMIPYEEAGLTRHQYISGSYWVAKKSFMLEEPLNEGLVWGQGEDVEWSMRIRNKIRFRMNSQSAVKFMKQKVDAFSELPGHALPLLKNKLGAS